MSRLLGVLLLLGLVWLVWTQAKPWLEELGGPMAGAGEDATPAVECVHAAERANLEIAATLRRRVVPGHAESWYAVEGELRATLSDARMRCSCSAPACDTASQALDEMGEQLDLFAEYASGLPPGSVNPARRQERIVNLLESARAQL